MVNPEKPEGRILLGSEKRKSLPPIDGEFHYILIAMILPLGGFSI